MRKFTPAEKVLQKERKKKYDDDYMTANYERIVFQPRKEECFPDLLKRAVDAGFASSRQQYILTAIRNALADDGISIDDLPPIDDTPISVDDFTPVDAQETPVIDDVRPVE